MDMMGNLMQIRTSLTPYRCFDYGAVDIEKYLTNILIS